MANEKSITEFGFGRNIGAVAAWASGEDLQMIKANDEKSKTIALVRLYYTADRYLLTDSLQFSSFPALASILERLESQLYSVTG